MSHDKTIVIPHAPLEEANPQPPSPPVDNPYWRQELEELDRYFPRPTSEQAQQWADEELRKHDAIVLNIEKQLAVLKSALAEPFLEGRDRKTIQRKIEGVESELVNAKKMRQRSINLCGEGIRASKDCEPKRGRWDELRKRQRAVDNAARLAKEFHPRGW